MFGLTVRTIDHKDQRYNTVGDWFVQQLGLEENDFHIAVRVSDCGNWEYEALVAIHEIAEAVACVAAGIDPKTIDAFDTAHPMLDEPGDDFRAPYRSEHALATGIERVLCAYLGISWQKYDDLLARLMEKRRAEETNSTTQTA